MGAYLNKPIVEKERDEGTGTGFKYACTSMQGWRANQEDAHNCVVDLHDGWHMFAVYDGHGGTEVSKYTAEKFPAFLKERKFWDETEIEACLQKAFVDFDDFLRSEPAMKDLAKISGTAKSKDGNDSEDEADRIETIEESAIPLQDLIKRYGGPGGARSLFSAFLANGGAEITSDEDEDEEESEGDDEEEEENEEEEGKEEAKEAEEAKENSAEAEGDEEGKKLEKASKKRVCKSPIQSAAKKSKSEETKEKGDEAETAETKEDSAAGTDEAPKSSDKDSAADAKTDDDDEDDKDFEADDEEEAEDEEDDEEEDDDLDNLMLGAGGETPGEDSGTTACVCLYGNKKLIVANAGDSRAVLCRAGKAVDLSVDHKPEDEVETKRIHAAGGVIEDGRVNGGLNLSRALGDHAYKKNTTLSLKEQMITAHPDVKIEDFTDEDEFLIVACDGIWNSMESQEVVDFARKMLADGKSCNEICDALCDACLADSTDGDGTGCDNMTVICTQFIR